MGLYNALKNLICHFEPGANNEFQEFEDFVNAFLK